MRIGKNVTFYIRFAENLMIFSRQDECEHFNGGIPMQQGNWDQNSAATKVPLVLQKLVNKIERSLDVSSVNQGSKQAAGSLD